MRTELSLAGILLGLAAGAHAGGDLERRAAEAVAAHQLVEARGIYRTLAEQEPTNPGHEVWVGRLSSWLSDYAAANAAFDRALALDAGNAPALVGKAYVAMWQERFDVAETLLRRAKRAASSDTEVHLALARNAHFRGRDRTAARHVAHVLALDPGHVDARELERRLAPEPERLGFFARLKRILTGRS